MHAVREARFLPEVSEHTAALGPYRTSGVVGITSLDLRT